MQMSYARWGFAQPPFQTTSLPATDLGERLLVGRDKQLASLMARIQAAPKMSTVEGLNGVGKTSLVNVASYKLYKAHVETGTGPLFIPCRRIFQLDPNRSAQDFIDMVLMEVAQTLIERSEDIKIHGDWIRTNEVDRWLNAGQLTTFQGGVLGATFGAQTATNTSSGYEQSGFRKAITGWRETIYPDQTEGGVICTIDNLELLQTSDAVRALLEQLRDELFNMKGIRWVLCGSLGIIYGVVSSPRLEGFLHKPIELEELGDDLAAEIFASRIDAYRSGTKQPYLPLRLEDFVRLHEVLNGNLRSVLSSADEYCLEMSDDDDMPDDAAKKLAFETWLSHQAKSANDAVEKEIGRKAMSVFEQSCAHGVFSPSDHEEFGFKSIPAFRPHIKNLEAAGLLVSTQDEGDKRRKTIQVTAKGWMVKFHRQGQALPEGG